MYIDFKSVLCVSIFILIFFIGITSDSFIFFILGVICFLLITASIVFIEAFSI